jgi:hypothetical protein
MDMKIRFAIAFVFLTASVYGQNIGIGTTTPRGPLSFSNAFGDKIVFYHDGNPQNDNYGIGIQSGMFQFHTYKDVDNFMFGFGNSGIFYERMKILNKGADALNLGGRIVLKNGTTDPNNGPGIWFYDPDNSAKVGFMGIQNSSNMGFYSAVSGFWGFTYNVTNGNIGIANNNPTSPLSFSSSLGKKISLYQGATGDAGLGTYTNQLQIYNDNQNGEIALGYMNNTVFLKTFGFKSNGAIEIHGTTGSTGQVLASNGSNNTPATWTGLGNIIGTVESSYTSGYLSGTQPLNFYNLIINTSTPAKAILYYKPSTWKDCFFGDCHTKWTLNVYIDGALYRTYGVDGFTNSGQNPHNRSSHITIGPDIIELAAGSHTISFNGVSALNDPFVGFQANAIVLPK